MDRAPQAHPTVDALILRHLAEKADGYRGENLCLIWRPESVATRMSSSSGFMIVTATDVVTGQAGSTEESDEKLIDLYTAFRDSRRKNGGLTRVEVDIDGKPIGDVHAKYDAIFWSEAAIEKFMFGYYLRNLDDEHWQVLYDAYAHPKATDPVIYAFGHLPDSTWDEVMPADLSVHLLTSTGVHTVAEFLAML